MFNYHFRKILRILSLHFKGEPTGSRVVIWVNNFQTELMVGICSKSLVRAIAKALLMKFS